MEANLLLSFERELGGVYSQGGIITHTIPRRNMLQDLLLILGTGWLETQPVGLLHFISFQAQKLKLLSLSVSLSGGRSCGTTRQEWEQLGSQEWNTRQERAWR